MVPKRIRTVEGSCWPCKDRRVICDLQQPECSRCATSGRACNYSKVRLKWCNGIAARGRFAGRNDPVSAAAVTANATFSTGGRTLANVTTTTDGSAVAAADTGFGEGSSSSERSDDDGSSVISLSPSASFSVLSATVLEPAFVMTADHLMLYFQHEVLDRFNVAQDRLQVDVGSACKDPALLQSVTAVANAHHFLYARRSQQDAILAKKIARLTAIKLFRERLQVSRVRRRQQQLVKTGADGGLDIAPVKDLFVINVLFCILDGIIEPLDEGAATYLHFRGGRAILAQWGFLDQLFRVKKGLSALMLSIFATMDLTHSLLTGERPYFSPESWMDFADCEGWWGVLPPGDQFLEIMAALSHIARLGHQYRSIGVSPPLKEILSVWNTLDPNGSGLMDKSGFVITSLPAIPLEPSAPSDTGGSQPLNYDRSWEVFCSAYRQTALIYIYRAVCNLPLTHPRVQRATEAGHRAICETRLAGKLSHCLLFPTLVIGSQCLIPEQQRALRKNLLLTGTFLYFGSIPVMDQFLQKLWATPDPDVSWWDCFESISRKTFLF
ncbi:fungal-specific transcription factor domain-containing protein [Paecilomyces variotii]|uniref:Fungal-specific transcription factor domain-containing protein n=1 Tax=Byssochlamys spectabilis TaxID=264951 RepID=A0A443I6I9_BYSSP|nr:fungal-specific transcription factor domain-containing protein [Paecilomyces variotii]KAJ9364150.1 transcriptional regulator family: Fungal Specific TF [Paecilomyces variotii]RWQ99667.1 fungal-specific transcription factor domain-containing protein [Paecilomyces variotii]